MTERRGGGGGGSQSWQVPTLEVLEQQGWFQGETLANPRQPQEAEKHH